MKRDEVVEEKMERREGAIRSSAARTQNFFPCGVSWSGPCTSIDTIISNYAQTHSISLYKHQVSVTLFHLQFKLCVWRGSPGAHEQESGWVGTEDKKLKKEKSLREQAVCKAIKWVSDLLSMHTSKPQFRPNKDQQNRHDPQPHNHRIELHPPEPALAL